MPLGFWWYSWWRWMILHVERSEEMIAGAPPPMRRQMPTLSLPISCPPKLASLVIFNGKYKKRRIWRS